MWEVEMKFRLGDPEAFCRRIQILFQAKFGPEQTETDLYFRHCSRDFVRTDEALRIRRVDDDVKITYKGPKRDRVVKTREEIELPLWPPTDAVSVTNAKKKENAAETVRQWTILLTRLGFEPVIPVVKTRRSLPLEFRGRPFTVTWDRLDGLGDFAEIETLFEDDANVAEMAAEISGPRTENLSGPKDDPLPKTAADGKRRLADARAAVLELAETLDLHDDVRLSYLGLLLSGVKDNENMKKT